MLSQVTAILQIIAIFLAFLSGAIGLRFIYITRGGLASQAIGHIIKGSFCLLLAFMVLFIGMAADQLGAFSSSVFLFLSCFFLSLGFGFICWGEWILFKELS